MNKPMKHTPGPWAVKEVPTSVGRAFKINTPDKLDESHGVIACIYADSTKLNERPFDEHEANAYLIASTPNLLAERDKLREEVEQLRIDVRDWKGLADRTATAIVEYGAMRERAEDKCAEAEAERDKWMARFDEAEHRGLAYMEERDKLREALRLMLVAIPDGWEVPLLYGQIVAQCRAVLEESSICRGLAQQGTIDRGSFAQYADDESTVTTSPETRAAIAESAKQMEEKP